MKLIILDRDGVINKDSDNYIKSPKEWIPIPGSLEAIARLNKADYRVVVATNQSGIARGLFDLQTFNNMHQKMCAMLERYGGRIDGVFFCPHGPDDKCKCRKPKAGLFKQITRRLPMGIQDVPAVGDSLRDIQAASRAGARPYLVLTGKGHRTLMAGKLPDGVPVFDDLAAVVDVLIGDTKNQPIN
ncbi:MAG: D-glycero-beta-D-manno-heptose 1,7-bisphosphate 7-phosphatase [Gammaproteobacteria bacterium]|nr:D-glycero-beta-D-manno-heptose 1,7-bisphosphate 7-phosphatase [Gammaproteobacteria bacterium]